jgi:hypothetical protein
MQERSPENCVCQVTLPMRPSERDKLRQLAGDLSVAAYLRGLINAAHGGCWNRPSPGAIGRMTRPSAVGEQGTTLA